MLHLLPAAQRAPFPASASQPGRGLVFSVRPTRKALDRRQRLREAGAALFATQGIGNTPIHQIAQAAGVSFRTARDDYPSRAALLHDILHAHLDALTEAVGAADERHANAEPAARLSGVILALFATLRANRHAHALLAPGLPSLPGPAREDIAHAGRLVTFRLYTIIEAAVPRLAATRELRAPITRLLLGDATQWFRDDGALASEDYAALLARLLIDGAKSAIALHRGPMPPLPQGYGDWMGAE